MLRQIYTWAVSNTKTTDMRIVSNIKAMDTSAVSNIKTAVKCVISTKAMDTCVLLAKLRQWTYVLVLLAMLL